MPPPKKLKAAQVETGAPANAKLLETHAADAEREVVRIKDERQKLQERIAQLDGNEEQQKPLQGILSDLGVQLEKAYDLWFKLSKQVREYDRAVDQSRREGESIPRLEVETLLTQTWRFQRLGRESFIVAISQEAIRCKDEQDFYAKYAEAIRQCETTSLKDAIDHEKAPAWMLTCYGAAQ